MLKHGAKLTHFMINVFDMNSQWLIENQISSVSGFPTGSQSLDLAGCEDPMELYTIIGCSSLRTAFIEGTLSNYMHIKMHCVYLHKIALICICVHFLKTPIVMKFKQKPHFMEFALLLLQRALQEDQLELLSQCGQEIFSWLSRFLLCFML